MENTTKYGQHDHIRKRQPNTDMTKYGQHDQIWKTRPNMENMTKGTQTAGGLSFLTNYDSCSQEDDPTSYY